MFRLYILMFVFLQSCSQICDWQTEYPDNFAEEALEDFIENTTGYEVDLTPFTGSENQIIEGI